METLKVISPYCLAIYRLVFAPPHSSMNLPLRVDVTQRIQSCWKCGTWWASVCLHMNFSAPVILLLHGPITGNCRNSLLSIFKAKWHFGDGLESLFSWSWLTPKYIHGYIFTDRISHDPHLSCLTKDLRAYFNEVTLYKMDIDIFNFKT